VEKVDAIISSQIIFGGGHAQILNYYENQVKTTKSMKFLVVSKKIK
jgi:hypothetical protein